MSLPENFKPVPGQPITMHEDGSVSAKPWWDEREIRVTAETRLIGIRKVMDRLDLRKTAIYEGIKSGIIPPPVKMGFNSRWPEDEITELQARLIAARRAS